VFFGRYAVLAVAGTGGKGQVYKALDTRLTRTVAVKEASMLDLLNLLRRMAVFPADDVVRRVGA
jgi:hypothetical protein